MSTNSREIIFPNLVESCQSLSNDNGKVVTLKPNSETRAFSASNARCEPAIRTRSQVREHAQRVASLMCDA